MTAIRSDLVGVVHVENAEGVVVLKAGDTIPEGAVVGDHLIDPSTAPAADDESAEQSADTESTVPADDVSATGDVQAASDGEATGNAEADTTPAVDESAEQEANSDDAGNKRGRRGSSRQAADRK